jgi:capsular polysaccharide biosynthesis protein
VVLVVAALTAGVAYGVDRATPERYSAEATVTVPAVLQRPGSSLDLARQLAATYAEVVPRDAGVVRHVGARVSLPDAVVARRLSVERVDATPLLHVEFRAPSREGGVDGAVAAAEGLAAGAATTPAIAPGTVELISSPRTARRTGKGGGERWAARSVVLVRAGAASTSPGDANDAISLARTYAALIPEDRRILERVGAAVGLPASDVDDHISVVSEFDTSMVRLRFRDGNPATAVTGVRALVAALAGDRPASPRIEPGSIRTVAVDAAATADSRLTGQLIPIAAFLGLLLGAVIVVAWSRADRRVGDVEGMSRESFCPASDLDAMTQAGARALVERWERLIDERPIHVALVPAGHRSERAAPLVANRLNDLVGPTDDRFEATGAPGGPSAGEGVALEADLAVIVARRGSRATDIRQTVSILEQFGSPPRWALLVSSRRRGDPGPKDAPPASRDGAASARTRADGRTLR